MGVLCGICRFNPQIKHQTKHTGKGPRLPFCASFGMRDVRHSAGVTDAGPFNFLGNGVQFHGIGYRRFSACRRSLCASFSGDRWKTGGRSDKERSLQRPCDRGYFITTRLILTFYRQSLCASRLTEMNDAFQRIVLNVPKNVAPQT